MINSIIEKRIIDVPWPVYIDGDLYEGDKIKLYSKCSKQCILGDNDSGSKICEHGLSHITRRIGGKLITISCVYISSENHSKRNRRNQLLMQRKASNEAILRWFSELEHKVTSIESLMKKEAKHNFDQFHEFVKWAREIAYYSERLLSKNTKSTDDAFSKASEDLKSLYKISVMLLDSLDTAALYFNPAKATFGRKKYTDVYSMIHKIKLIFSHTSRSRGRADIEIKGRVNRNYNIYESFKIVPLSLIQNAIKYKKTGNVEVVFDESDENLKMTVNSVGSEIPEYEIKHLFERGFRAKEAIRMSVDGSGLGLYVLKIVTDAHNFKVQASSTPILPLNKKLARNSFTVTIS
ncbi:sensor histidine kinase [Vibrio rumoiensis]|uniref:sensor histidine kinase n=1 Tax=Vibrio rumoiensis TaxID=76258 RepID=UPI003AA80A74